MTCPKGSTWPFGDFRIIAIRDVIVRAGRTSQPVAIPFWMRRLLRRAQNALLAMTCCIVEKARADLQGLTISPFLGIFGVFFPPG